MYLSEYLKKLTEKGDLPMHMPGHKRKQEKFNDLPCLAMDYTEIEGTDNLHDPKGVIMEGEKDLSTIYSSKKSYYGINGSTGCLLAAIRAMTKFGDEVLIARNCHKSVYHGLELCGLVPTYIYPKRIGSYGIFGSVSPEDVEQAFEHHHFSLVVLTSPTYEGVLSDTKTIYEICKKKGALLLVDEAHGAHLPFFMDYKPYGDVVVESFHKTLPSLTQTAVLHLFSDRVEERRIERELQVFETSSPSYILMSSIDYAVNYLKHSEKDFSSYRENLKKLRFSLGNLKHFKLLSSENENVYSYDEGKIVLLLSDTKENGEQVLSLFAKEKVVLEMAGYDYVLAMTTVADEEKDFLRFEQAVKKVDSLMETGSFEALELPTMCPKKVMTPLEAYSHKKEDCSFSDLKNAVCGSFLGLYPPGVPLAVEGEFIDEKLFAYLEKLREAGFSIENHDEFQRICENI